MHPDKIKFTSQGYTNLQSKLAELENQRVGAVERLQTAREMGDLSENGAYKVARFEVSDIDRNRRRLSFLIKNGVVEKAAKNGVVGFGNQVTLEKNGEEVTYLMVSKFESEPREKKLSIESPLGQALVGKRVGDEVRVVAPIGEISYRVKRVSG